MIDDCVDHVPLEAMMQQLTPISPSKEFSPPVWDQAIVPTPLFTVHGRRSTQEVAALQWAKHWILSFLGFAKACMSPFPLASLTMLRSGFAHPPAALRTCVCDTCTVVFPW